MNEKIEIMSKEEFDSFVKSDLIAFMSKYGLQKMTVDDGSGKSASINRDANNNFKIKISSSETL